MANNCRKILSVFCLFLLLGLSTTNTAAALTFKTSNNGETQQAKKSAPKSLLADLVTRKRNAVDLSDEELCTSLTALDTVPTYYEMKKRGLECLSIDKVQSGWRPQEKEKAVRYLRAYAKKYSVQVPNFDVNKVQEVFGSRRDTMAAYQFLQPNFRSIFSISNHEENQRRIDFCHDWFPQVATIMENQSKNLDGTVSWEENSLRDGFVICQNFFNYSIYRALFDQDTKQKIKAAIENWVSNDTPHRDTEYEGSGFFGYTHAINKILIAIELLHQDFGWDKEQYNAAQNWAKARVLEFFPGGSEPRWKYLSKKCPTNISSYELALEVCQNGGILQAQATLRAGIFAKDPELVELSYIAFHRYMSGIRKDGSNIADSRRGCTAADYNIWASQFMTDYLYLWSLIGDPLWGHRSFDQGSPKEAVEYSLSLIGNFEKINEYTHRDQWKGCGEDAKSKTQQASNQPDKYPLMSFAPYFFHTNKNKLIELMMPSNYERRSFWDFTHQSGTAFEASLLLRNSDIVEMISRTNEENIAEKLASKKNLDERYECRFEISTLEDSGVSKVTARGRVRIVKGRPLFRKVTWSLGGVKVPDNHLGQNSDLSVLDDGRFVGVAPLFTKTSNDKVTPFKFGSSFSNDGRFLPEGVNVGYTAKNLKAETASLRIFNCYLVPDVVVEKPQPSEQPSEEKFAFKPVSVDFTPLSIEFYRLFENDEFMNFKAEIKDSEGQQFGDGKLNIGLMFDFRNLKKKQKNIVRDYKISVNVDGLDGVTNIEDIRSCEKAFWEDDGQIKQVYIRMKHLEENRCVFEKLPEETVAILQRLATNMAEILERATFEDQSWNERVTTLSSKFH